MASILATLRKRRRAAKAELKAQVKAAKTRAKAEVAARSKAQARQAKLLAKQEKALLKTEQKGLKKRRKHELKLAKTELDKIKEGRVNASTVKRYAGVLRAAAPLLLPLIYRGIVAGKEALAQRKAQKMGLNTDQLAAFKGHGAPLKARIAGIRNNLKDLDDSAGAGIPAGFKRDVKDRLDELDAAVDNAEYMTPQQRIRAHSSISNEIDAVSSEIQEKLQ